MKKYGCLVAILFLVLVWGGMILFVCRYDAEAQNPKPFWIVRVTERCAGKWGIAYHRTKSRKEAERYKKVFEKNPRVGSIVIYPKCCQRSK